MKITFRRLWIILFVTLFGLLDMATPVHASPLTLGHAHLTIDPLKPVPLGDHPVITVTLINSEGVPVRNESIRILVDGVRKAQALTDSNGRAVIPLRYKFVSGKYEIKAVFLGSGTSNLEPTSASAEMVVEPARAVLRTIPPMPGIRFKFDGRTYISDANGEVNITVQSSGAHALEVMQMDKQSLPANTRVDFIRWNDPVFTPYRVVYFPRSVPLEAGFIVSYQVDQAFFDSTGAQVDPSRVSLLTLRGIGRTYMFDGAGLHWLPSNNLSRRIGERLQSEAILYYFRNVTINGANVINKSEQRFYVRPNEVWPVKVLLYSAHFTAHDAMFGFPIGKGIRLLYPDGHTEEFLFNSNRELDVTSLPRGSYKAMVIGAGGSSPLTPIHLSRNQDVELLAVSYADMAVIFGAPALVALTLLLIGRPQILARIRALLNLKRRIGKESLA